MVVVEGGVVVGGGVVLSRWEVVVGVSVVEELGVEGASVVVLSAVLKAAVVVVVVVVGIVVVVVVAFGVVTTGPTIEMKFIIMDNVGAARSCTLTTCI